MIEILSAIVLLGILVFVHELGHFIVAKMFGVKVEKFSLGFGPKIVGIRVGDTQYLISAIPLGGYVKLLGESEEEVNPDEVHKSFQHKSLFARMSIVLAGPVCNILWASLVFFIINMWGVPKLEASVGEVVQDSPAYKAGIQEGDRIVKICGKAITYWEEVATVLNDTEEEVVNIEVERMGEIFSIDVIPERHIEKNIFGEEVHRRRIGIIASNEVVTVQEGFFSSAVMSVEQTYMISKLTIVGIVKFIQGKLPSDSIGGPIRIVQLAGQQAKSGVLTFFFFGAILSINLGLLNLFPIPMLDGGHLFFFLIELVAGKPISFKKREIAQQIGMAILITLMILIFYNDIKNILTG